MISAETLTHLPFPAGSAFSGKRIVWSGSWLAYDCMKVYSYQSEMRFAYDGLKFKCGQSVQIAASGRIVITIGIKRYLFGQ